GTWKSRVYEWLQRRAYRKFSTVVAVSRPQVELLASEGVPARRTRLLRNAWNPAAELLPRQSAREKLGTPAGDFRIGWVGRLSREKGADVLLDAFGEIGDSSVTASIIGAGREEAALRARASALEISDRVTWHGLVPAA